jgi:hypothetical protein
MPKQYSKQETFDIVARALAAQGRKSMTSISAGRVADRESFIPRCQYRGDDGCRCAAGVLIPDERYTEAMEGRAVMVGPDEPSLAGDAVMAEGHDLRLAADLQHCHDGSAREGWLVEWTHRMRRLADRQGLSTAALDEALAARAGGEAVSS